jgi:hypothetical protein
MISPESSTDRVRRFFSGTGTTYDRIVNLCTLGFDRLWKYPQWKTVFDELPGFLRETQWILDLVLSLQKNGFSAITPTSLTWGTSAIIAARKERASPEKR